MRLIIAAALMLLAGGAFGQTTPHSKANHLTENATQNYVTANEMGDRLDEGIHNHAAFAMADADVTLTAAQHFETSFFELTGANTAVRSLVLRSECGAGTSPCEKRFVVLNNTTGGFDVRVKYATGAAVNVSPGVAAVLQGDGTDIISAGSLDINQLTAEAVVDPAADYFPMWDESCKCFRKVLGSNLPGSGGSSGGGLGDGTFRGALVHTDDTQTITNATWTALDWDVQDFDTDEIWEGATNPTRFTIPNGWKKVRVCANATWASNSTNLRTMRVQKNGVSAGLLGAGQMSLVATSAHTQPAMASCSGPIPVGDGDYLEVAVFQNTGGNLDVEAGTTNNRVWGSIELLDPPPGSVAVLDNSGFGNFRGALILYEGTSEALVINVPEYVQWDTEQFDTDGFWAVSPNPSRLTIPAGVNKVMVGGSAIFGTSAGNRRWVAWHKNGSAIQDCTLISLGDGGGSDGVPANTCIVEVTAGDYFEMEILADSSSVTFDNGFAWIMVVDPAPAASRATDNQLVNGDFQVCQRLAASCAFTSTTSPANSDAIIGLDRWVHLTEVNDSSDYGRETSVVPGAPGATTALKSETETADNKFGWVQILPNDRSKRLIGSTASLSFKARSTTGLQVTNVRAGVLCWTGTVDSVTRDVVSVWNTPGTNPTPATSWIFENTPADLAVTLDAYASIKIEGIAIDSVNCANVAAFIWVDEDTAVNDLLYITDVQLEPSGFASGYQRQDFEEVLRESERHYRKSFPVGTSVAQNAGTAGAISYRVDRAGTVTDGVQVLFGEAMFAAPTITFYNPAALNTLWRRVTAGADCGAASATFTSQKGFFAGAAQCAAAAAGNDMAVHWSATAEM